MPSQCSLKPYIVFEYRHNLDIALHPRLVLITELFVVVKNVWQVLILNEFLKTFPFLAIKEQTGCGWIYKLCRIYNIRFNLVMNETILIYIYIQSCNIMLPLLLCWAAMLIIFCHEDSVFISLFSMTMFIQSPAFVMHRHH